MAVRLNEVNDILTVFEVECAEIARDMDRRAAAGGAAALLPAGHLAAANRALGAVNEPAVRLVAAAVFLREFLSDLPTASHVPPSQQKRPPLARGETGRRSSPVPGAGQRQPAKFIRRG